MDGEISEEVAEQAEAMEGDVLSPEQAAQNRQL